MRLVHEKVMDTKLLKQRLLKERRTVAQVAKEIGCGHNSVANRVRRVFTVEEREQVNPGRKTHTKAQKIRMIQMTFRPGMNQRIVAEMFGVNPTQLSLWKSQLELELSEKAVRSGKERKTNRKLAEK
jgi:transposase-like protein